MSDTAGPMPLVLRLFGIVKMVILVSLAFLLTAGLVSSVRNTNWPSLAALVIPITLLLLALRHASSTLKIDVFGSLVRFLGKVISRR